MREHQTEPPNGAWIVRPATPADSPAIAAIYNEGIAERSSTFETRPRSPQEVEAWFDGRHLIIVAESGGEVAAFASTSVYRPRDCYRGVAEFSIYVSRDWRGRGVGRAVLAALVDAAEQEGLWKLVARVFVDNAASRRLLASACFREVGIYRRHGELEGVLLDVVIVERLIGRGLG